MMNGSSSPSSWFDDASTSRISIRLAGLLLRHRSRPTNDRAVGNDLGLVKLACRESEAPALGHFFFSLLEEARLIVVRRRGRERWNHLDAVPIR